MSDHDYPRARRLAYGDALFIPVCKLCGRYVKADETVQFKLVGISAAGESYEPVEPNATCSKHGRVAMVWEGYV